MQTLKIKAPLICKLIKNCKAKTKHTTQGIEHLLTLYNSKKITPNNYHQFLFFNSKKKKKQIKIKYQPMHTSYCSAI